MTSFSVEKIPIFLFCGIQLQILTLRGVWESGDESNPATAGQGR